MARTYATLPESTRTAILETALARARAIGAEHGTNAGRWYALDDVHTARDVADVLAGADLRDDPNGRRAERISDTFPAPDLSGEWADTMTGPSLFAECIAHGVYAHTGGDVSGDANDAFGDAFGDVCDAYDDAFGDASRATLSERARYVGGLAGAVHAFACYVPGRPTFYVLCDVLGIPATAPRRAESAVRRILADDGADVTCTAVTL